MAKQSRLEMKAMRLASDIITRCEDASRQKLHEEIAAAVARLVADQVPDCKGMWEELTLAARSLVDTATGNLARPEALAGLRDLLIVQAPDGWTPAAIGEAAEPKPVPTETKAG